MNLIFEICKKNLWGKIEIIKIRVIYEIVSVVAAVLTANEFEFFGLRLVVNL